MKNPTDKQIRISGRVAAIIERYAKHRTRVDGYHWSLKSTIAHLVKTHPEIAKADDKEV